MAKLSKLKLRKILESELHLKDPRFKLEVYGNRVSGNVISETFRRKQDHQRQKMIWDALKRVLGEDAYRLVGMVLAYTPDEWDIDDILEGRIKPAVKAKAG